MDYKLDPPERIEYLQKLNPRQLKFVAEYVKSGNGYEAACLAGYSEKSAKVTASKMLKNPLIQRYLQEFASSLDLEILDVLKELKKVGFASITDVAEWDENGSLTFIPSGKLPKEAKAAVKSVSLSKGKGMKIEFHDKIAALEKLRRHLGGGADDGVSEAAGSGVTVLIIGGPFGFERQEPPEQQEIEEG